MNKRIYFSGAVLTAAAVIAGLVTMSGTSQIMVAENTASMDSSIFGVNMSLNNGDDQLVTSAESRKALRDMRVPFLRVPMRAELSEDVLLKGLNVAKEIGAVPVVILRGTDNTDIDVLAENKRLLELVNRVFGNGEVYLELGNEDDLTSDWDEKEYTEGWNKIMPELKKSVPASYKFAGPVNYEANPEYIGYFAKNAEPKPDLLSWHEYTCDSQKESEESCVSDIQKWSVHAEETNQAVRQAIGKTLPFMISEWNFDPEKSDRYDDADFVTKWTTDALTQLEKLRASGLIGAMVYTATNGDFTLLDSDGSFTLQGEVFHKYAVAAKPSSA